MPSLLDRFKAFVNPTPLRSASASPQDGGTGSPAPVIPETMMSRFQVEQARSAVIKDCRAMYDADPRIEKMHRDYARDLVKNGFIIQTSDEQATQIAKDLQKRLKLNQKLEDWARLSILEGDSFLENTIDENLLISKVTRKPTLQVHRNSNKADEFDNPERAYWMADDMFPGLEAPKDAIWFPVWQMIHARWNHDEHNRYGRPMMRSARKHFKYVEDGELNVAVRRKIAGGQIRHHIIEGSPADVEAYKENNKASIGKLAAVIDLFSNKQGSLDVHEGDGNIDKIADVEHNVATLFTGGDVPMELIAYGKDLNRDILGEKKEQYDNILNQAREWTTIEIIQPLMERQWLLQGILPSTIDYKIIWRKAKTMTPADLRDLADAITRLKLLNVKDEILQTLLAMFMRDVDEDILNQNGFSVDQLAQNLKGISI